MAIGAQRKGFPLSNGAVAEIVGLDLLGAAIALVGIIALALRSSAGLWLAGLVVVETIADVGIAIRRRRRGRSTRNQPDCCGGLLRSMCR
jgi:hypothetical protein